MIKYEHPIPVAQATVKYEIHDDHVIVIIDGGTDNQFRCRLNREENSESIDTFCSSMAKWIEKLNVENDLNRNF